MLGVNKGHLFKLNITPKMQIHAWFHAFSAIASKSVKGSDLCTCLRKKIQSQEFT